MGKGPEELLEDIDLKNSLGQGKLPKRVSTKILILTVGIAEEKFRTRDVKGHIVLKDDENIEDYRESRKEVRDSWGIASGRTIEKILEEFLEKGLLEKDDENDRIHHITGKGRRIWSMYVDLLELSSLKEEIGYLKSEINSSSIRGVEEVRPIREGMSDESIDQLIDDIKDKVTGPESYLVDKKLYDKQKTEKKLREAENKFQKKSDDILLEILILNNSNLNELLDDRRKASKVIDLIEESQGTENLEDIEAILESYNRDIFVELEEVAELVSMMREEAGIDVSYEVSMYDAMND